MFYNKKKKPSQKTLPGVLVGDWTLRSVQPTMFASRFDEFSLSGLRFRRQILTVLSSEQEAICRERERYQTLRTVHSSIRYMDIFYY